MALLSTLFLAYFIGACAPIGVSAERQGDFRVNGLRVVDLQISAAAIAWIDDERILLRADTGNRVVRADGTRKAIFRAVSLNHKTGARKEYGRADSQFCYSDGYVSAYYEDDETGELVASYGELGKEIVRKVKPGELVFDTGPRGSCRPWVDRPKKPTWVKGGTAIWPLSPYLGMLNCNVSAATVSTQYVKARFHAPADEAGIDVPFSCYDVSMGLRFYPFKNAYFALEFDFRSPWPEGRDRRAFWLYPDGRVEIQVLKYSTAIREIGVPTARGIVTFAQPSKIDDDYWIYLVTPAESKRILRGYATGVTSPDGCRVAMLHDPEYKARIEKRNVSTRVSLKVLELCEKN